MKKIHFVRHGETDYNVEGLVQDHSSVLTKKGKEQAQVLGARLQHLAFDHLISSDYIRTKETTGIVEEATGKRATYSPLFREVRHASEFFHKPYDESFKDYQREVRSHFSIDENWKHSDEESFKEVQDRIAEGFALLEGMEGDVVVISHGHYIRRMVATVAAKFNLSGAVWDTLYDGFWISNTGITTITEHEYLGGYAVLTVNDRAHFADT